MDDIIHLRLDALPLVRSVDFCVTARPFVHLSRTLDYHVLVYILKGGMQIIEMGTAYELGPGEMVLLKAGLHHWGEKPCPAGTTWIYIHFHLDEALDTAPFSPYSGFVRNHEFVPSDYRYTIACLNRAVLRWAGRWRASSRRWLTSTTHQTRFVRVI